MRKKIVAGNWKMNKTLMQGRDLALELNYFLYDSKIENVQVIICTPFIHLPEIVDAIEHKCATFGAQNCSSEEKGAFTGEVSAEMISSCGASHVIVGHSERRHYFNEDNFLLRKKVKCCLKNHLVPIYCCGEKLQEREENKQFQIVKQQLEEGLFNLSVEEFSMVIIAYEPVWAIGTGVNATPEQAQEMHAFIRSTIASAYGNEVAEEIPILYGGSCNPGNARELFSNPDVDGGLIGGASLNMDDFGKIINSF